MVIVRRALCGILGGKTLQNSSNRLAASKLHAAALNTDFHSSNTTYTPLLLPSAFFMMPTFCALSEVISIPFIVDREYEKVK